MRCAVLTLALAAFASGVALADPPAANGPRIEKLPPKVRPVVIKEVGDGTIDSVERAKDGARVVFDIEFTLNGRSRMFTVTRAGELLDEQVFLEETPAAVQKIIKDTVGAGKLGEIDKSVEDGQTEFDVEMTSAAAKRHFTVGADGKLLSREISLADAPAPVQKTLQAELKGAKIETIELNFEEDPPSYEIDATRAGKSVELTIAPDGDIIDED